MTTNTSGFIIGSSLAGSTLPTQSFLFAPWHFAPEAARCCWRLVCARACER